MLSKSAGNSMLGFVVNEEEQRLESDHFLDLALGDSSWEPEGAYTDRLARNKLESSIGRLSLSDLASSNGEEKMNDGSFKSNDKMGVYGQTSHAPGRSELVSEAASALPDYDEIFEMDETRRPTQVKHKSQIVLTFLYVV